MTSPVPDALRTQLAEVLPHEDWCHHDMDCCGCTCDTTRELLVQRRLLPVIAPFLARARAEGAAEALREAADEVHVARLNADQDPDARWPVGSPQKVDSFYAGCVFARNRLRRRAAALSAPTTTEGDPT